MEEIARVYSEALFAAAKDEGNLDQIHTQLGQLADSIDAERDLQVFFFSPHFSPQEKREGIDKLLDGADAQLVRFLELLIEKHRIPAIFRIRRRFDQLWAKENRRLEVIVTSAVELDSAIAESVGDEIERQTGQTVELRSEIDPEIVGGLVLRVGNMVLDASIRNRLERLRKEIAQAA